jgi:hypothetical protein
MLLRTQRQDAEVFGSVRHDVLRRGAGVRTGGAIETWPAWSWTTRTSGASVPCGSRRREERQPSQRRRGRLVVDGRRP